MGTKLAGSLEPISQKGKWHEEIDGAGLGELNALATDITKTIDTTVKQVARGKIKVGKLLREAKSLFISDNAFGKWRKECTPVQSKQHAHYLMQVAERFGNATVLIDGANYSIMQELVLADQKDIEWVEAKIDDGELPTVQEVRAKVKETSRFKPQGTSKKGSINKVREPQIIPNAQLNEVVKMQLRRRIQEIQDRGITGVEGAYVILGMDPDPQCPANPQTIEAIGEYWFDQTLTDDDTKAVSDAKRAVQADRENWNI